MTLQRIGGVEAGGTKFVCALGHPVDGIRAQATIPTTTPDETLRAVISFFKANGGVDQLGIASFGPLALDRQDPNYGRVAKTPKAGWSGADIVGTLQSALDCVVSLDTDVNGSGLAEARLGAGRGLDVVAYVTVGTGVGGGLIVHGRPIHGLSHPEMGHILLRKQSADADFAGVCPFHGHCVEGLTSGPAILARLGHPLSEADPASPIFDLIAGYLGEFCAALSLMTAPQRIILGGGVMSNARLYPRIRSAFSAVLADYLQAPAVRDTESYICAPELGDRAGVIGAMLLAMGASGTADLFAEHANHNRS